MPDMSAASIFAGVIFSGIGMAAFIYGKKQSCFKPMGVGGLLMIYPYFISNLWILYGIGIALTVSLFVFND